MFESNRNKDRGDMTRNRRCVTIARSRFVNKNTRNLHVYQANHLEQRAVNRCIAGILILESPCNSTEESDYTPLSYDSKANSV